MSCEVAFDAKGLKASAPGTGSRLVEIVDDDMRRVALVGERETVMLARPGQYGAILKLDGDRTVTKAFNIVEGTSRVVVAFTAASPAPPPGIRRFVGSRPAIVVLLLVLGLGGLAAWLASPRMGMTEIAYHSEPPPPMAAPADSEFATARQSRMRQFDRNVLCTLEPNSVPTCEDTGPIARDGPPSVRIPTIVFERAMRPLERPGPSDDPTVPSTADAPQAPVPGSEQVAAPAERSGFWTAILDLVRSSLFALAAMAAVLIGGSVALFRGGIGTASNRGGTATILLERARMGADWFGGLLARPASKRPERVQVAVVQRQGFDMAMQAQAFSNRRIGETFQYRLAQKLAGLPRAEISLPGAVTGMAVMVPALQGETVTIEIRREPGEAPQPHVIFGDADVRQMLRYRESFRLEESAELAAGILIRLPADAPIANPASVATALYLTLRTGRLALDIIASPAARLVRDHAWLPDAHVILGEIAARQARHADALQSLLKVATLGPPFTTAGVTYLSDRLALYDAHLEKGLGLGGLRPELDRLLSATRDLARRMIAGRIVTTFAIGQIDQRPQTVD